MECVSAETERELREANRAFVRSESNTKQARARLAAAIIEHKRDGASVASIEDMVTYRRGRITAILDGAGLVEKKTKPADGTGP